MVKFLKFRSLFDGSTFTGHFMAMKLFQSITVLCLGFTIGACVFDGEEGEETPSTITTTLRGDLGVGDTVWNGVDSLIQWEIPLDSNKIASYRTGCDWTGYLGHGDSSTTYTNSLMGTWNALSSTFGLFAPKDSTFTHYRIKVKCTE